MQPIPLAAPDGTVYTYACGLCHNVQGCSYVFTPKVAEMAESYRQGAERCCRCTRCQERKAQSTMFGVVSLCAECRPLAEKEADERRRIHEIRQAEYYQKHAESLNHAKDEEAAKALCVLMSEMSEEHWCAQWLMGLEYTLWQFVLDWRTGDIAKRSAKWGMFDMESEDLGKLSELSERAGGWWMWNQEHDGGELFVPMAAWLDVFGREQVRLAEVLKNCDKPNLDID